MCEIYADEMCSVWVNTRPVAKKAHQCACCSMQIQSGQKYLRNFSVFDGNAHTDKWCLACAHSRDTFAKHHEGFHPDAFALDEYLSECIEEADDYQEKRLWVRQLDGINRRRAEARKNRLEAQS